MYLDDSPLDLSLSDLELHVKNHENVLKSMDDFLQRIYTKERDQRVGLWVEGAGNITKRFTNLIVQQNYVLCVYLKSTTNTFSNKTCLNFTTSNWGTITKISVNYSKVLSDQ